MIDVSENKNRPLPVAIQSRRQKSLQLINSSVVPYKDLMDTCKSVRNNVI